MSEMNDIYCALMEARSTAEALATWQTRGEGRDHVRSRQGAIERGIQAYERLSAQLREGRKHVEAPEDFNPTGCMCSWPTVSPPCSWCTDPANSDEDIQP